MQNDGSSDGKSGNGASGSRPQPCTAKMCTCDGRSKKRTYSQYKAITLQPTVPEVLHYLGQSLPPPPPSTPLPPPPLMSPMSPANWKAWWSCERDGYLDEYIFIADEVLMHVAPPTMVLMEFKIPVLPENRMLVTTFANLTGSEISPFAVTGTLPYKPPEVSSDASPVVEYYQRSGPLDITPLDVLCIHLLNWQRRLDAEDREVMLLVNGRWNAYAHTINRSKEITRIRLVVLPDLDMSDDGRRPFWMAQPLDEQMPSVFELDLRLAITRKRYVNFVKGLPKGMDSYQIMNAISATSANGIFDPKHKKHYLSVEKGLAYLSQFWQLCGKKKFFIKVYKDFGKFNMLVD